MDLDEMAPMSVDPEWYDAPETWHSFVGPIDLGTARADDIEVWGEPAPHRALETAPGTLLEQPGEIVPAVGDLLDL